MISDLEKIVDTLGFAQEQMKEIDENDPRFAVSVVIFIETLDEPEKVKAALAAFVTARVKYQETIKTLQERLEDVCANR